MSVLTEHRFSVKEYYRMAETGVLSPDARVELLDGKIIDMSPIGPFHGDVTTYLTEFFAASAKGRWRTRVQNPIQLDEHSEPQPDVVLAKPIVGTYHKRHPGPSEIFLLIEVSDSTLAADVEEKLPIYGRAGITEVWIVNLNESTVEVYREQNYTGYGSKTVFQPGQTVSPLAFPDVVLGVAELLKR